MTLIKLKYTIPFFLALTSNCNSSITSAELEQAKQSKWTDWTMPSPPKIDVSKDKVDTLLQTKHFRFITHNVQIPDTTIEQLSKTCEQTATSIRNFLNSQKSITKINYHIYPSIEQKALRLSIMDIAHIDEKRNDSYIVWNDYFHGEQSQKENTLLLRKLLGKTPIGALEVGLNNHFTQKWQQKGYPYWCGLLYAAQNLPPLSELVNNAIFEKESELVMGAMAGVFVDFLMVHLGKKTFLNQYTHFKKDKLLALESAWQIYLSNIFRDFQVEEQAIDTTEYVRGFNFAHEGYRIYNGYGSQLAKTSLEKMKAIGTNAVAIVPYSYMRHPNQPSYLLIDHRAGSENDESVLFAHFEAKAMGMFTLLKPQIWIRQSWPGDVRMQSEQDWAAFFDSYYRWMRHYALLAEINGFNSLCIGVEFANATLAREKEWRHLIRQLRGIYSGYMTYAANWGDEFEKLGFWDELDYIGLNCYYPLSNEQQPSKRDLKKAFKEVNEKIEKVANQFNKPVVFTEIGFRSVEGTWVSPHAETNNRAFNEANQALAYKVVFEEIENKDWCRGILWWKWPSYLEYGGRRNTGFAPTGKMAEQVVAEWFSKG